MTIPLFAVVSLKKILAFVKLKFEDGEGTTCLYFRLVVVFVK